MQILRAEVEITHPPAGGTVYVYPLTWLANKEKIPTILYPDNRTGEIERNGKRYQIVYPLVPDDLVDTFLKEKGIELADPDEVQAYGEKHMPKREAVVHEQKVMVILAKFARGESLSDVEKEALDPAKEEPGVTLSKSFLEVCEEYGWKR